MAAMKDLSLDHGKVNVNGGACSLGHPIGATGARILTTLLYALKNRGKKRGIASLCIGGGEATAIAVECSEVRPRPADEVPGAAPIGVGVHARPCPDPLTILVSSFLGLEPWCPIE